MNVITVNGQTYTCENGSIKVVNGKVYCNDKLIINSNECNEKNIKITIEGDVGNLITDTADVVIKGNCTKVNTQTGDVVINGDVLGDITSQTGDVVQGGILKNLFKSLFD